MEGFFVLVQEDSGPLKATRHPASCFPRVLNLAQSVPCLLMELQKLICCAMETLLLGAGSCFHENNHRTAHVLFGGFYRDMDSLPVQFCLSRGRWISESQVLIKRGLMMRFSRRAFFASRISQWISPHDVHAADHDMRQRQLQELVFESR
jgi:hypothetical protein